MRTIPCAGLAAAVVLAQGLFAGVVIADEPLPPATLQPLYEVAQKLAADPATQDEALARLQTIVAIHRANTEIYNKAFLDLLQQYTESGGGEEAARLVADLGVYFEGIIQQPALNRALKECRDKFPEAFSKVSAEQKENSPQKQMLAIFNDHTNDELSKRILQRGDKELRDRSIEALKKQLAADADSRQQVSGLFDLNRSLPAKFDRAPFRELVLPLLKADDPHVRYMAVTCLGGVSENRDDLAALVPLVDDPSPLVRAVVARALISIGKGKDVEIVTPAIVKLLRDKNEDVLHGTIQSMWGEYHTPELSQALIELSDKAQHQHVAIYFGLSPQKEKSVAVCRRLVDELADPDWNNSGRAAWGLTYGVVDEAKPLVEEGLLAALPEETNSYTRKEELRALQQVATEKSRPYLERVAAAEDETDEFRAQAREILAELDARR